MELDIVERARVRRAKELGELRADIPAYVKDARRANSNLKRLQKAWSKLSESERDIVRIGLAQMVGGNIDPWLLDVGKAADASYSLDSGSPSEFPGTREVVQELTAIWKEHGKPTTYGNLRSLDRNQEQYPPPPLCAFVAVHLRELVPEAFANLAQEDAEEQSFIKADTQIRALLESDEIWLRLPLDT